MRHRIITILLPAVLLVAVLFAGCSNNKDTIPPATNSRIMFVNAVPDAGALSVLVDGAAVESDLGYFDHTQYLNLATGDRTIQARLAGTGLPFVVDTPLAASANYAYSVYFVDTVGAITPLFLNDVLVEPDTLKARVRFLQLSPGLPPVDLNETNGDSVFVGASNIEFKGHTNYVETDRGTYSFELRTSGTGELLTTFAGMNLEGGQTYTLVARGFRGGAGGTGLVIDTVIQQ
ncbi:MAG: DUF4397 domain-containing protein [Anaerolineales bacterium]|jgi:hypothetical protein